MSSNPAVRFISAHELFNDGEIRDSGERSSSYLGALFPYKTSRALYLKGTPKWSPLRINANLIWSTPPPAGILLHEQLLFCLSWQHLYIVLVFCQWTEFERFSASFRNELSTLLTLRSICNGNFWNFLANAVRTVSAAQSVLLQEVGFSSTTW